jgi:hypothetical protein
MRVRNVEVTGGYNISETKGDGKEKSSTSIFMEKRSVVVPENMLEALFRRDWELCSMPVIRIRNTNKRASEIF